MAVSKIAREIHEILIEAKRVTIPANSVNVTTSLDVPTGYSFLGIMGCSSTGWIGHVYTSSYRTQTPTIWTSEGASTSARDVNIFYEYYR